MTVNQKEMERAREIESRANACHSHGQFADTEPLYFQAVRLYEIALGEDHEFVAAKRALLIDVYLRQNKHKEAKPLCEKNLLARKAKLSPDHPDLAESLLQSARLYLGIGGKARDYLGEFYERAMANLREAESLCARALAICDSAFGPTHQRIADCLLLMADILQAQERFEETEPFAARACAMQEKILGPAHADVIKTLNKRMTLYMRLGKEKKRKALLGSIKARLAK